MKNQSFIKKLLLIALPISIQSLFQSSLSVIDQFMVGQLGEESISAIAFCGKYMGIISFTIFAITGTASIMMAQYIGNNDKEGVKKTFSLNITLGAIVSLIFLLLGLLIPNIILSLYTNDLAVIPLGTIYLRIVALTILPILANSMMNSYLQNNNKAYISLIVGLISVIVNTILNAILINGVNGFISPMGVKGAAIATLTTQYLSFILLLIFTIFVSRRSEFKLRYILNKVDKSFLKKNMIIATPLIITEFMWSLGESVYAVIYGHISTEAMAAMANMTPIISLSIGFFSGVAAASGILCGKEIGEHNESEAYKYAKRFIKIELIGSILMGILIICIAIPYANIYKVSAISKAMTVNIMIVYAVVLWSKVSNMVCGRIIQSGGVTIINLIINLVGTWIVGIPLGLLAANVLHLEIHLVYLLISIEEIVRCLLCFGIIKTKKWINFIGEEVEA